MRCGLLGKKLGHSYSPQIHRLLGSYTYALFEKDFDELDAFLKDDNFSGLNVTIPYKKDVIPYCDELTDCARKLGAVNTIVRRDDGTLVGHNSDYYGFQSMLRRTGVSVSGKKALVLGSGGASATVTAVLHELHANVVVISRNGVNNYENISLHSDAQIIVNTTPVGMYPNTGVSPLDLNVFPNLECVLDVIYNPSKTKLLLDAEAKGIQAENGLWMLIAQAKESAEWFTGIHISDDIILKIHTELSRQMRNIVLIGMPGCGKSSIGKQLAQRLNRTFVDSDASIEALAGMPIPEIFDKFGEERFRQYETEVLKDLGKQSGLVIATGGGCVTKLANYPSLRQNSIIIWIRRDLSILPIEGRPLSQQNHLQEMYQTRKPMYDALSDYSITNDSSIHVAVQVILSEVGYQ